MARQGYSACKPCGYDMWVAHMVQYFKRMINYRTTARPGPISVHDHLLSLACKRARSDAAVAGVQLQGLADAVADANQNDARVLHSSYDSLAVKVGDAGGSGKCIPLALLPLLRQVAPQSANLQSYLAQQGSSAILMHFPAAACVTNVG